MNLNIMACLFLGGNSITILPSALLNSRAWTCFPEIRRTIAFLWFSELGPKEPL